MPEMSMEIEGLDQLDKALEQVRRGAQVGTERAVEAEAEAVAEDMRADAPVDQGELIDSIEVEGSGLEAEAVASAAHAGFVNFGTSTHVAQPFASTAVEAAIQRFPERVADDVAQEMP